MPRTALKRRAKILHTPETVERKEVLAVYAVYEMT